MSAGVQQQVKDLKQALLKEVSDKSVEDMEEERCRDILEQLESVPMSLAVLTETLIGATVAKLKSHPNLGSTAKELIQKWKKVAAAQEAGSKKKPAAPAEKKKPALSKIKQEKRGSTASAASSEADASAEWSDLPSHRQNMCKKFYDLLERSKPELISQGINEEAIGHLTGPRAAEVEAAMHEKFKDKQGYMEKARSLAFNLKKNKELCEQVILGQISGAELVSMPSEQLAKSEEIQKRAQQAKKLIDSRRLDWDQANEDKINKMCGIKGDLLKASLFTCGRCKSVKTTSTQKQTRSADEPMTVFVLCLNCGKRWKC